jgi:hypothetical protein
LSSVPKCRFKPGEERIAEYENAVARADEAFIRDFSVAPAVLDGAPIDSAASQFINRRTGKDWRKRLLKLIDDALRQHQQTLRESRHSRRATKFGSRKFETSRGA